MVTFTGSLLTDRFSLLKKVPMEGELNAFESPRLILRRIFSACLLMVEDTFEVDRPGCAKLVVQCLHRSLGSLDGMFTIS